MSTKLPNQNAKAFFSRNGFEDVAAAAKKYAPNGQIVTIPDLIAARMNAPNPFYPAWRIRYITTLTSEFFGKSPAGHPIIVVAHNVGPLSTVSGITEAYSHKKNPTISREEFKRLCSGEFGPVEIIDYFSYLKSQGQYPHDCRLTEEAALSNQLLKARIGPQFENYIARHASWSRTDAKEQSEGRYHEEFISKELPRLVCIGMDTYKYLSFEKTDTIYASLLTLTCYQNTHYPECRLVSYATELRNDDDISSIIRIVMKKDTASPIIDIEADDINWETRDRYPETEEFLKRKQ